MLNCLLPDKVNMKKMYKSMPYSSQYACIPSKMATPPEKTSLTRKDLVPSQESIFKSVKAIFPNFDLSQIPSQIEIPQFKPYVDYQNEFWRVYLQNEVLIQKMKEYLTDIKNMQDKLIDLEKQAEDSEIKSQNESGIKQKKKNRRTANQIVKTYQCPYEQCSKVYGSEISLNLHIKIKHQGGNKSDREKIANVLISAKINGKRIDDLKDIQVKLPPNYIKVAIIIFALALSLYFFIFLKNYLKFHKLKKKNKEELIKKLKKLSTIENDDKIEEQIKESLLKERQRDLEKILRKQREHIDSSSSSGFSQSEVAINHNQGSLVISGIDVKLAEFSSSN